MATIKNDSDGSEFECLEGDTILRAALRAGFGMPYSCNVGSCGNCRFELIDGNVTHLREDAPAWTERDLKRNRWLGCQSSPNGPCTIKFRADASYISKRPPLKRAGKLVAVSSLTHDISEFSFEMEGPDDFLPGQYALLNLPGVTGGRAYSMCNLAGEGVWNFQIKNMPGGAATSILFSPLEMGATVEFDGPYGTAYLKEASSKDMVLLAGGSGLSPMVSIARGAVAAGMLTDRKMHFFYGGKETRDIAGQAQIEELPGYGKQITFTAAISEKTSDGSWNGPVGFIHHVAREKLGDELGNHEIYFAGPAVMGAAVQKMIYEMKIPMDQLHFDVFY